MKQEPISQKRLRFEIRCIEDVIRMKEARGADATFERDLAKSFRRHLKR